MRTKLRQQLARVRARRASRFIGPPFFRIPWPEIQVPLTRGQRAKANREFRAAMDRMIEEMIKHPVPDQILMSPTARAAFYDGIVFGPELTEDQLASSAPPSE